MRANRKRIIFTKITVNVCAFCLLDKLTVNGYHIATMNEAERLTEKENNMKKYLNSIDVGFDTREELDQFLKTIEDDNDLTDRQYYILRHAAINKFYEED